MGTGCPKVSNLLTIGCTDVPEFLKAVQSSSAIFLQDHKDNRASLVEYV